MRAAVCLCSLALGACALTSKGTPLEIRYFTPETLDAPEPPRRPGPPVGRLRLGRIGSSANLRYRIVHRESAVELEPYETLRWTETPEDYVRRSLSRALFQDEPLEQVVGGAAPVLEVELVAFEEAHRGERHVGRVQIRYQLHDERSVLTSGVVTVEREAKSGAIDAVVPAIGAALDAACAELARDVVERVRSPGLSERP